MPVLMIQGTVSVQHLLPETGGCPCGPVDYDSRSISKRSDHTPVISPFVYFKHQVNLTKFLVSSLSLWAPPLHTQCISTALALHDQCPEDSLQPLLLPPEDEA